MSKHSDTRTGMEVAVIGMASRFPGAGNSDEFWENLKNGQEAVSFFSEQELKETGLDAQIIENSNYIKANSVLEDAGNFDASFFQYTPREAEVMHPQVRVFLQCSWHALEDAGYDPGTFDNRIGLYAGGSSSFFWEALSLLTGKSLEIGAFAAENLTNKDHLCTQVSYKLGLKGPACVVQTACSTSLVAIHWACRAVLSAECRMALAGGVTVLGIQKRGYMYAEGMIRSSDGHTRTFDAKAKGIAGGSGAGVVVLKRLKHALADGDHIYALVKGSAINNDGKRKVGFTAPSVEGQAEVIHTAMAMARVEPESIGYIEAHGTGTGLGDPVEIEALTMAFKTPKRGFCPIGSVKSNLGHLDSAAGVSGFIKAVLALKNRQIPPSLHYETSNPGIDFEQSPFYVNTKLQEWKNETYPLRAGVSSFGIGGTNAHVVLEEWPEEPDRETREPSAGHQLFLLSANSETALRDMAGNLVDHFKKNPGILPEDAAYTLQVGRKPLKFRLATRALTLEQVIDELSSPEPENLRTAIAGKENHVVFMFPGQGAQYVNMGLELYQREPIFRQEADRCFEILKPLLGYDIKDILYPPAGSTGAGEGEGNRTGQPGIDQTEVTQPVIFLIEYALARLLMEWGIKPDALIGHSIGEYVAACLAGVFSLEHALTIVAQRGQLMQAVPAGAMLSVPLPVEELETLLQSNFDLNLDLAAVNSSSHCVVSGPGPAIESFARILGEKEIKTRNLHTSHAFHSKMMDPALSVFEEKVRKIQLHKPDIPFISNVSGDWIPYARAVDPGYWAEHMRKPVLFARGLDTLLKEKNCVFIEVGPGKTLSTFARRHINRDNNKPDRRVVNLMKHPEEDIPDRVYLADQISRLWLWGVNIDWNLYHRGEKRRRQSLPLYPFEKQHYWIEGDPFKIWVSGIQSQGRKLERKKDMADWFYIPSWKKTAPRLAVDTKELVKEKQNWLVFFDDPGLGAEIVPRLKEFGHEGATVTRGEGFSRRGNGAYTINAGEPADYDALIDDLKKKNWKPGIILHLWSVTGKPDREPGIDAFHGLQDAGYYSLVFLTRALAKHEWVYTGAEPAGGANVIRLAVITDHVQAITETEELSPGKATVLGPCNTIPLEYRNVLCRNIDVDFSWSKAVHDSSWADRVIGEVLTLTGPVEPVVAYRGKSRWLQYLEPVRLEKHSGCPLKLEQRGIYLITGGLGRDSLARARYLAETLKARLILTGRSSFPERKEWDSWLEKHGADDPVSEKIKQVQELESLGGEVLVMQADAANEDEMKAVMAVIDQQFGRLNGVIHAAGITTVESSVLISKLGRSESEWHFKPKVYGVYVLEKILKMRNIDFCILTSSLATFLPGGGVTAYTAANIFMDAYVHQHNQENSLDWMSLNWVGVSPEETAGAFHRIANLDSIPQLVVFDYDFYQWLDRRRKEVPGQEEEALPSGAAAGYTRPEMLGAYTAPEGEMEKILAGIWERFFGIKPLGRNDNFFELGGNSLDAITIISKIHMESDVELSLAEFFQNPTIKELARYVENYAFKRTFISIEPSEKKEYYEPSSAQKRLYFIQQMYLDSTVYNIFEIIAFEENLDRDRMEATFQKLIMRHEALRTSFHMVGKNPVQKIHQEVTFKIEYDELMSVSGASGTIDRNQGVEVEEAGDNPGQHLTALIRRLSSEFIRPFDLTRAPLLRVRLTKLGESQYVLLLDLHHIISDRTAHGILQADFISLYSDRELSPLKLQYRDYTRWQGSESQGEILEKQEVYWLNEFSGEIPVLHLPTDYPRPGIQSFEGSIFTFNMSGQEARKLKNTALETGVTTYMVLLAILNTLMAKLSGQEDIVIGTTAAGRRHADIEDMIGMFVNTLAIRNHPAGEKSFKDFLIEVKQGALSAFENQDYFFEDLVGKVAVNRDPGRNPLFDIMFDFHSTRESGGMMEVQEVETDPEDSAQEHAKGVAMFDMIWVGTETGEMLSWQIIYCTKLFKLETLRRMVYYFRRIFQAVLENPALTLAQIEIISPEEKQQVLYEFNESSVEFPADIDVSGLFVQHVNKFPGYTALIDDNAYFTYEMFNERVNQLALFLRERGVRANVIVAIMAGRSMEMMIGIFAILKAGGAYFPLDPKFPVERIKFMIEDTGTRLVLCKGAVADEIKNRYEAIDLGDMNVDTDSRINTNEITCTYDAPARTDLAYIIYTSGSTGRPKGVIVERHSLVNFIYGLDWLYPPGAFERYLLKTSFLFDVSIVEIFGWILGGGGLVLLAGGGERDPRVIIDTIVRYGITHINFVPSMFNIFIKTVNRLEIYKLTCLRFIFLAGEELLAGTVDNFRDLTPDIRLENLYGPTESTVYASQYSLHHREGVGKVPIGKPFPNITLYIIVPGVGFQPPGIPGELCISGLGLARGYLNRPQLTFEKFVNYKIHNTNSKQEQNRETVQLLPPPPANITTTVTRQHSQKLLRGVQGGSFLEKSPPGRHIQKLYKTGDLARWLGDGNIEYLGRGDSQVKVRGFRIELGEIENLLLRDARIKEAVVMPRVDKLDNVSLCAYVVSESSLDTAALRNSLSGQLPDYMVPSHFVCLESVPLTPTGKIDKKSLPEPEISSDDTYIAPRDRMERVLCEIWAEILGIETEKIGTAHNFFKLGGNSLNLIMVVSRIYKEFAAELSITQIYENPTIMEISKKIKSKEFEESQIVLLNRERPEKIFCFPPQIAYGVNYMELAALLGDYSCYALSFIEEENRTEKYVELITGLQPGGPYVLFGYSAAGPLTFEVARALENRGHEIGGIIFLDCFFQEDLVLDEEYYRFHYQMIGKVIDDMGLSFLREKIIEKSRKYMQYCESDHSLEKIHTNIHLILSEHAQRMEWSGECWEKLTLGEVVTYKGYGHHREVFFPGIVRKHAEIMRAILKEIKEKN